MREVTVFVYIAPVIIHTFASMVFLAYMVVSLQQGKVPDRYDLAFMVIFFTLSAIYLKLPLGRRE